MQTAGCLEESLRLPEFSWQGIDGLCGDHRSRWDHGAAAQLELFEARLAAHPAGARGVEVALQTAEVVVAPAAEIDVYDVITLLCVHIGVVAVTDLLYVVRRGDDALAVKKARGELEVRARRTHGDGDGLSGTAGDQA